MLDTVAFGIPLITTTAGIQGLDNFLSSQIDHADTPNHYADRLYAIYMDYPSAVHKAEKMRQYVDSRYNDTSYLRLFDVPPNDTCLSGIN